MKQQKLEINEIEYNLKSLVSEPSDFGLHKTQIQQENIPADPQTSKIKRKFKGFRRVL